MNRERRFTAADFEGLLNAAYQIRKSDLSLIAYHLNEESAWQGGVKEGHIPSVSAAIHEALLAGLNICIAFVFQQGAVFAGVEHDLDRVNAFDPTSETQLTNGPN